MTDPQNQSGESEADKHKGQEGKKEGKQQQEEAADFRDRRILIIGFGFSGIVQCHTFLKQGFRNVTVMEKESDLGGVWNMAKQYPDLVANNSKRCWYLPELLPSDGSPAAAAFGDFATQEETFAYLKEYVDNYKLEPHVQYGTEIVSLSRRRRRREGKDSTEESLEWEFDVSHRKKGDAITTKKTTFDLVVCATGFCSIPHIPDNLALLNDEKNNNSSGTTVIHSSAVRQAIQKARPAPLIQKDMRVAVIGAGKSAQDVAAWVAEELQKRQQEAAAAKMKNKATNETEEEGNKKGTEKDNNKKGDKDSSEEAGISVDFIAGRMYHLVPQYFFTQPGDPKGLYEHEFVYSRFMSWMIPGEAAASRGLVCNTLLDHAMKTFFQKWWLGRFFRDLLWWFMLGTAANQLKVPEKYRCKETMAKDSRNLSVESPKFFPAVRKGHIRIVLGRPTKWTMNDDKKKKPCLQIVLRDDDDGDSRKDKVVTREYDLVICATGWKSSVAPFLSDELKDVLFNKPHGQLRLYRQVFCPDIPQLAFCGIHQNNMTTLSSATAARWICEMAKGPGQASALWKNGVMLKPAVMTACLQAGLDWELQQYKGVSSSSSNGDDSLQTLQAPGYFGGGYACHQHVDGLLADLGCPTPRPWYWQRFYPQHVKGLMAKEF